MKFFSGFCIKNEKDIFKKYIINNDFTVSGFSKGGIKALNYCLNTKDRIDTLQLFSPAFFLDKDETFKRAQVLFYKKDPQKYLKNFLKNLIYPIKDIYIDTHLEDVSELKTLLYYKWEKISDIKNINIEVYLGEEDKIINTKQAKEFFKKYAQVYYIKNVGHLLKK